LGCGCKNPDSSSTSDGYYKTNRIRKRKGGTKGGTTQTKKNLRDSPVIAEKKLERKKTRKEEKGQGKEKRFLGVFFQHNVGKKGRGFEFGGQFLLVRPG